MKKNILTSCLKPVLAVTCICIFASHLVAQSVSINNDGSAPDNSAILDVKSNTRGMLIPRMTTAQRTAITSPAAGLMVFDTNTFSFWYYTGLAWRNMNEGWSINGNAGTDPTTHFIGTTTFTPLAFKVNNERAGFLQITNGNTSLGHLSMSLSATGGGNTAIGNFSLSANGAGAQNTANGYGTLYSNINGNYNTASGFDALYYNSSGTYNVATGYYALAQNTTGNNNVAVGSAALYSNVTGNYNTAVGDQALFSNTIGASNVAAGINALRSNTEGSSNNATGYASLYLNTTGNYNVAHGALTLANNTIGSTNTALGQAALLNSVSGNSNTAVGHDALVSNEDGSSNTALGAQANVSSGSLSNATAIGFGAVVNASNKVRIGNGAVTVIEGQVPFTTPSDGRFKFNVQEDVKGLDFIMHLRPVTYQFDVKRFDPNGNAADPAYAEAAKIRRTGFIAQEVEAAAKAAGYHFSGIIKPASTNDHYGLSYESFVAPLVKGMQEQQQQLKQQQQQLDMLKKENEELKKMMQQLTDRLK